MLLLVPVAGAADYSRIIAQAYREILAREPDPGGLAHYNGLMAAGLSEAALREMLIRSSEYAERFPGGPGPTPIPTPTPGPTPTPTPAPTPTPPPVPTLCACKPFVRWGLAPPGTSSSMWLYQGRQVAGPILGGAGHFDSVQRFGSGNGVACDSDHPDNCRCPDGRVPQCEDRRGPIWSLAGPGRLFIEGEWGFQAKVQLNGRGHYALKVCPRVPLLDGHGREVELAPGKCGTFEWDVR